MSRLSSLPLLLALIAAPAGATGTVDTTFRPDPAPHPFNVRDLVMMDRLSDAQISPDGHYAAFSVRTTDYAKNKGDKSVWVLDLRKDAPAVKVAKDAGGARWAPDGHHLYYVGKAKGVAQLFRMELGKPGNLRLSVRPAAQVTHAPLDLVDYKLSPDGKAALLAYEVFTDCDSLACTKKRLDARKKDKATGVLYDKLFIRHWDTWSDGRRNQLYVGRFDKRGQVPTEPTLLSREIDGDVPSKPWGDNGEFAWAPDGKSVFFDVRIAGKTEPWSTNFDIYQVPADGSAKPKNLTQKNLAWDAHPVPSPDGKTLYYLAMKEPGFEADRFGIMALDLASGALREVDPKWDRSPGDLDVSSDGRTLYATADDQGEHPLFTIDPKTGKVTKLVGDGTVHNFSLAAGKLVLTRDDLKHPADLYLANADGTGLKQVSHSNVRALKLAREGDFEFFTFKGHGGDTVQGYVVKPVDFEPGKKYPVAFIIHGGPQGAMSNGWSYRWNPQTYAGQGLAVVTINFHGSTGYGQAFTNAISGDWGGKPLEDLQLGWKAAQEKFPWLDGGRACALGASYGGYMVDWIAGVWNQPWKCLITHDGVFDARGMYYSTEELWFEEKEHGGPQFLHPERYEKFDPLTKVANWRVPMMVVHSGQDFRIPLAQGIGAFTALQRRGIPSELLYFPDENHWVLKPHNSVQWHDSVNAWLKKWTAKDASAEQLQNSQAGSHAP
jgi:dipeptidyl aminopeptidase/acylaminoacyl peptidase